MREIWVLYRAARSFGKPRRLAWHIACEQFVASRGGGG